MQSMSTRWLVLILLLCLALATAGWASVSVPQGAAQHTDRGVPPAGAIAQSVDEQPSMVAVAVNDDADCDNDGCQDGHCKHRCACGCAMGTCATPCGALLGQPWTFASIVATDAMTPLIAQSPGATRATSPLRPPIA